MASNSRTFFFLLKSRSCVRASSSSSRSGPDTRELPRCYYAASADSPYWLTFLYSVPARLYLFRKSSPTRFLSAHCREVCIFCHTAFIRALHYFFWKILFFFFPERVTRYRNGCHYSHEKEKIEKFLKAPDKPESYSLRLLPSGLIKLLSWYIIKGPEKYYVLSNYPFSSRLIFGKHFHSNR